uniref:contractile injection system protein, VgrG/Pvc8 family n=1 Tax=Enterocloster clostridioformis TaxID=1531 RepID=UPI0025A5F50A|nr:contractile injection system protein, VgrG/Pvc8 family [Enterocloster clostridioformis]
MREEKIVIHPFDSLRVTDYHGQKQINEHLNVVITGQIPFDKKDEYVRLGGQQTWAQVVAVSQEGEQNLFYGLVDNLMVEVKNSTCTMILRLVSGTILMDQQEKARSFQSDTLTFGELLDTCNQGYDNSARIMTSGKGKSIGQFIMQYKETDWKFIKRLASMNQTVVVADCSTPGEKYYFGIPNRKVKIEGSLVEYREEYDTEEYLKKRGQGLNISPFDIMSYIWESRDIYELGDVGIIGGCQQFVWKIESEMKGNELYHTYYMKPKLGFQVAALYNIRISGVTLFGKVTKVKEEKVQIEIFNDNNRNKSGKCWFTYATVYSSQDGTGWYCMPEIGDKIRLYFPTDKEQDAYVASACHEAGAALRYKPECKSWRNKEGKEIRLEPGKILLTNNDGTYIEMSDDDGVQVVSDGSVTIRANESLYISSTSSSIELSSSKKVVLKQGNTEMSLGGDFNMRGARIKL